MYIVKQKSFYTCKKYVLRLTVRHEPQLGITPAIHYRKCLMVHRGGIRTFYAISDSNKLKSPTIA